MKHLGRKASEHTIKVQCADDLLLARMDAKLIIQVIINLVDNAVKYTPSGSDITILSRKNCAFADVSVSDNVEGIPDDIKPHVFEMFYMPGGTNGVDDNGHQIVNPG